MSLESNIEISEKIAECLVMLGFTPSAAEYAAIYLHARTIADPSIVIDGLADLDESTADDQINTVKKILFPLLLDFEKFAIRHIDDLKDPFTYADAIIPVIAGQEI